ncbi:MAG: nascent polypeptide-associated complex protein [Candidatus Aenigmatarchaeota archaeon]|nr:MAG: nascent polypeptide-associated complex protein [Candidatus Aenigmarchaeota archaeon]
MFPNINPKQMEKMARQMGMQLDNIDAIEVIIKTPEKDILIKNPQVTAIKMQGQQTFQIAGEVVEQGKINEEDIDLIVQKTNVSKEEAQKLLEATGDVILAIKKAQE